MSNTETLRNLLHIDQLTPTSPVIIGHSTIDICHVPGCDQIEASSTETTWGEASYNFLCGCVEVSVFKMGSRKLTPDFDRGSVEPTGSSAPKASLASAKQISFINSLLERTGVSEEEALVFIDTQGTVSSIEKLTTKQASGLIDHLKNRPAQATATEVIPAAVETILSHDGKFDISEMTPELIAAAQSYSRSYNGTFSFMNDMKAAAERGTLSAGQAKGALNCMRSDRSLQAPKVTEAPSTEVPEGYYALTTEEGAMNEIAFYKVDCPTTGRWAGYTFLNRVVGGEEISVRGAASKSILARIAQDPEAASRLYGREIGSCGRCGKVLTNDSSRAAGIGPVCESIGW